LTPSRGARGTLEPSTRVTANSLCTHTVCERVCVFINAGPSTKLYYNLGNKATHKLLCSFQTTNTNERHFKNVSVKVSFVFVVWNEHKRDLDGYIFAASRGLCRRASDSECRSPNDVGLRRRSIKLNNKLPLNCLMS
jgi:hypothetical protein